MTDSTIAVSPSDALALRLRVRVELEGRVQGVGFRPFVYREAAGRGLAGWVRNHGRGVSLEVEGEEVRVMEFLSALAGGLPGAQVTLRDRRTLPPIGESQFRILPSAATGEGILFPPPDRAVCAECVEELFDPADRRHRYPFTTCVRCGPRYTIVASLPYDRPGTSMQPFPICAACRREYEAPGDRRFHAEATACPACGPALRWSSPREVASGEAAVTAAVAALAQGEVIAVKGIGGFHLMADAQNGRAVERLRRLKRREAKPLALMYPDLKRLSADAVLTAAERRTLASPEAPIVLVEARRETDLSPLIAPGNPLLGVMLPYAPVHYLILRGFGEPVIATSANLGEEPILIADSAAAAVFGPQVGGLLLNDRTIVRRADDSIVRIVHERPCPLRIGRGYAPVGLRLPEGWGFDADVLALGGQEKGAIALGRGDAIVLSHHLGDLDSIPSRAAFRETVEDWVRLFDIRPSLIVHDAHPDYFTTRLAEELASAFHCPARTIQHHHAHFLSALAESPPMTPDPLGVCWDGTGYGLDSDVWGGEWLALRSLDGFQATRAASLLPFPLPGGEKAIEQPWRVAVALTHAAGLDPAAVRFGADADGYRPDHGGVARLASLLARARRFALTTSVGRLFDGMASLLGLRHAVQFSAQAAMELEFLAMAGRPTRSYPFDVVGWGDRWLLDWRPMIRAATEDQAAGRSLESIAAAFHEALVEGALALISRLGSREVYLTGGCFQNRLLAEGLARRLASRGCVAHLHGVVPPNDGGLAAGQALAGLTALRCGHVTAKGLRSCA